MSGKKSGQIVAVLVLWQSLFEGQVSRVWLKLSPLIVSKAVERVSRHGAAVSRRPGEMFT
jgi:hypothetical protein